MLGLGMRTAQKYIAEAARGRSRTRFSLSEVLIAQVDIMHLEVALSQCSHTSHTQSILWYIDDPEKPVSEDKMNTSAKYQLKSLTLTKSNSFSYWNLVAPPYSIYEYLVSLRMLYNDGLENNKKPAFLAGFA